MAVSQTQSGTVTGAAQGAAIGSLGGPIGIAVGAVIGGALGALGGKAGDRAAEVAAKQRRLEYNERLRGLVKGEAQTIGIQRSRYAASGVRLGIGSVREVIAETRTEYARRQMFLGASYASERHGAKASIQAGQIAGAFGAATSIAQIGITSGWFDSPAPTSTLADKGKKQGGQFGQGAGGFG